MALISSRISRAVNIEDLRELARRRLPRIVFNYLDGGAEAEWTLRENRRAFDAVTFRPSQAIALPTCDLRDGMEQLLRGNLWSKVAFVSEILTHPRWLARFLLDGGLPDMPNIVSPERGVLRVRDAHTAMKRQAFSWSDMPWIRALWKGPIVIKGCLTA